ncbi:MAG: FMN-binding protein [Spirochaetae bacterium HGW-Spirochaetae-8]|nr:MAG: FMN-binding protein [Spirochaetae bacterium HGW-Spirochaetae-8]
MKQNGFYARRVYPLVFMFIVTTVCILVTSGIFLATEDRVRENELLFLRKAVLSAAGVSVDADAAKTASLYLDSVTENKGFYTVKTGSDPERYVIPFAGAGLWGKISLMVGFEADLSTLSGVAIVSQNETPGLGARIEEPWFTAQFAGKQGPFRIVEEGTATAPDQMDAITGATRTSESIQSIMNRATSESRTIIRGL